jgi:UDPglucose--hexose-1-phosphate uridylyltransferase
VVIAPERAKRPSDFIERVKTTYDSPDKCPFCHTGQAYAGRYTDYDAKHTYIIPNKFPAFVNEGQHEVRSYYPAEGFYQAKPAMGGHDVVIMHEHEPRLTGMSLEALTGLFHAYQRRYQWYRENPLIEYVFGFYNHGQAAGASISHPHGQIVASSIVPNHLLKEKHGSERYYEHSGSCVYCDMIHHERQEGSRVLAETEHFIMFTAFAARFPFETWILPKTHQSMYEEATLPELADLAGVMRHGLMMLDRTLQDPPINFYIHSLPTTSEGADYYHWHIEIAPRLALYAGYELGSGTIIDVVSPEKAAEFLRAQPQAPIVERNM